MTRVCGDTGHRTQEGSSCFPPARLLPTASFYLSAGREPRHASACLFLLRIPLQGSPGRLPSFVQSTLLRSSESIAETDPHTCGLSVESSGSPCPPTGLASLLPPRPLAPGDRDCTTSAWCAIIHLGSVCTRACGSGSRRRDLPAIVCQVPCVGPMLTQGRLSLLPPSGSQSI